MFVGTPDRRVFRYVVQESEAIRRESERYWITGRETVRRKVSARTVKLVSYMLREFPAGANRDDVVQVLNGSLDSITENVLTATPHQYVPLVVTRALLRGGRVPLDRAAIRSFMPLIERYPGLLNVHQN